MEKLFLIATLAILGGCAADAGNTNSSSAVDAQSGADDSGSLSGKDGADTGSADQSAEAQGDAADSSSAETAKVDAAPTCASDEELVTLTDGPACLKKGDEVQMAKDFLAAKFDPGGYGHPKANMMPAAPLDSKGEGGCDTIHDSGYCFPVALPYGPWYKPKFWGEQTVPFKVKMYLVIKFPDSSKPDSAAEVAFKECANGVCQFEDVIDAEMFQFKVTYTVKTKEVTVVLMYKGSGGKGDKYKLDL